MVHSLLLPFDEAQGKPWATSKGWPVDLESPPRHENGAHATAHRRRDGRAVQGWQEPGTGGKEVRRPAVFSWTP